jgi:rhodanese-related sulfurtransferase
VLLGAGFDAVNLDGGMRSWAADDFEVLASDGLPGTVI